MELKILKTYLRECDQELSDEKEQQFFRFYEMLIKKNESVNLTAITKLDEVQEKHFIDSIALGSVMDLNKDLKVADVGTGGGFPGIPLKIMYPSLKITLIDSLAKRVAFLNDVIKDLRLTGIEAIHMRAEDAGHDMALRESFDICVSRAVADLRVLSEYCLPLVKVKGFFIPYKSVKTKEELDGSKNALTLLGGEMERVENLKLGQSEMERTFIFIKKISETPEKYPRKAGKALKKPL